MLVPAHLPCSSRPQVPSPVHNTTLFSTCDSLCLLQLGLCLCCSLYQEHVPPPLPFLPKSASSCRIRLRHPSFQEDLPGRFPCTLMGRPYPSHSICCFGVGLHTFPHHPLHWTVSASTGGNRVPSTRQGAWPRGGTPRVFGE